jgi:hypothetical protein
MKNETMLIAAAVVGGALLLSSTKATNKVTSAIGTSAGVAAANITTLPVATFTEKAVENVLINPNQWAQNAGYIPIIDELALTADKILGIQDWGVYPKNYKGLQLPSGFPFSSIKKLGNDDKWFS